MDAYKDNMPNLDSNLRFFHAAPGAPSVDVYLNGSLAVSNLSFAEISSYKKFAPGKYDIEIYKHDTYDTPIVKENVSVLPNLTITVSAILLEGNLELFKLRDAFNESHDSSTYLRFINFAPDSPLFSLALPNNDVLFKGVEYLETTGYLPISPGVYDFMLTRQNDSAYKKYINNIDLDNDSFHTIYIIGLLDEMPELGYLLTEDGVNIT